MESETGQVPQRQDQRRRLTGRYLAGLVAVLVLLGLVRAWVLSHTEIIVRDGMTYTAMARAWTSGPMQVIRGYDYHVGYPVAIVGMHALLKGMGLAERSDSWDVAGGLVSLVASLVAMIAVWRWAAVAYDRWVAILAVLLPGLSRKWSGVGAEVLSDALAIAFQMWSLVLVHDAVRRLLDRRRSAVLLAAGAGLCGGLGYLVRPESLLIPVLGILLILGLQLRRRLSWRLSAMSIAVMVGAAALASLPYMIAIGGLSKKKNLTELLIDELARRDGGGVVLASLGMGGLSWSGISKYVGQVFEAMHPLLGFAVLILPVAILCRPVLPRLLREQAKGPSPIAGWLMLLYTVPMMVILLAVQRVLMGIYRTGTS